MATVCPLEPMGICPLSLFLSLASLFCYVCVYVNVCLCGPFTLLLGPWPTTFTTLTKLETLAIDGNDFDRPFPTTQMEALQYNTQLEHLWLSYYPPDDNTGPFVEYPEWLSEFQDMAGLGVGGLFNVRSDCCFLRASITLLL